MSKPFLSYDQQLDKLINDKKLYVPDRIKAKEILKDVGYFSLNDSSGNRPAVNRLISILEYLANRNTDHAYLLHQRRVYHNVCAHNERLFSFRTLIDFPDTALHAKLNVAKKGCQYLLGKRDLFGLVIAFRYLLPRQIFIEFKQSLIKVINHYCKQSSRISQNSLLTIMGFPDNWETMTRYHI